MTEVALKRAPREPLVLDAAREPETAAMAATFFKISQEVGASPIQLAKLYARLAFGRGKISFSDFVRLRLFDEAFHEGADLSAYVGRRRNRDLCVAVNHRHDWYGMLSNKVASERYLSAFGLPTIAARAIVAPGLSGGGASTLRDSESLRLFLLRDDVYPLFGKPLEGTQSLGSIALAGVDPAAGLLMTTSGAPVALDAFVAQVMSDFASGYLLQPLLKPHADIVALCGERLACLRVVTAATQDGPRAIRAVMKIPAGENSADNYWRAGNLLAQLDPVAGRILRATAGVGCETQGVAHHPDTGVAIAGFAVPHWDATLALALEGARVMRHVPLIGWDVACLDAGPVIVEMNEAPDLFLPQFADRRGLLDPEFDDFMAFQARNAAAHEATMRAAIAKL